MDAAGHTRALRTALGRFATGVTIVTCVDGNGAAVGLTANSFAALSLEPPLVLWALRCESPSLAAFRAAKHFAVNVLAESQASLSRRFASPSVDKFAEGEWSVGLGGAAVLAGVAALFECEMVSQQPAGDHVLYIGRVVRFRATTTPPLVFQAGHYRALGKLL